MLVFAQDRRTDDDDPILNRFSDATSSVC